MPVLGPNIALGAHARGKGGGAVSLPLDGLVNVFAAWSVRKLRTDYAGSCVRVRRSSDNAEADIGFDGSGWLDEAALLAHCGAGNGLIRTWYDQSGNGLHVGNSVGTQQPRIVASGVVDTVNGYPAPRHDGVDDLLDRASVAWTLSDLTMLSVTAIPSGIKNQNILDLAPNTTTGIGLSLNRSANAFDWTANDAFAYGSGYNAGVAPRMILADPGFADGALRVHAVKLAAAGSSWQANGVAQTATVSSGGTAVSTTGTLTLGSGARSGHQPELILIAGSPDVTGLAAATKTAFSIS